jgi:phenylalanine-4-hydroxylase
LDSTLGPSDLTTANAAFIDTARLRGELFVSQPYELYSEENHRTWRRLYRALEPRWRQLANHRFLEGLDRIALDPERIPRLEDVNRFLEPLSRFKTRAVCGYIPAFTFFDCLRRREFPTTITIRSQQTGSYLPEPDIFHDLAGHVPMHTGKVFSDALARFGEVAHTAARLARDVWPEDERLSRLESAIRALARFFWFTVEFGLMREGGELKVYGSGLLSSFGELEHSIRSPHVQRHPFQMEWVINQAFEIDHYQPLLFVVDSFEHLFAEVNRLEEWLVEGRLSFSAPGEPVIASADLESFLAAGP